MVRIPKDVLFWGSSSVYSWHPHDVAGIVVSFRQWIIAGLSRIEPAQLRHFAISEEGVPSQKVSAASGCVGLRRTDECRHGAIEQHTDTFDIGLHFLKGGCRGGSPPPRDQPLNCDWPFTAAVIIEFPSEVDANRSTTRHHINNCRNTGWQPRRPISLWGMTLTLSSAAVSFPAFDRQAPSGAS